MTFRTRLVLATTVAVVVAVLAASLGSFLGGPPHAARGGGQLAARRRRRRSSPGRRSASTTATLGQVIDTSGAVVSGGGLPVTGQVRLVAVGLAPTFFTTVTVRREPDARVRRAPARRDARSTSGTSSAKGGALQIATLLNVDSQLKKLALLLGAVALAGVLLAVVLGWLVARTALVPLNSLTDTVEDLAETTDVTRRLSPGAPGRARPAAPHLQPPARGARVVAPGPEPAGARRLPRAAHARSPACAPTSR